MTSEKNIQDAILDIINKFGYGKCWRANAGIFRSFDGKRIVKGLPKGFPDIFGFRSRDGKAFFIEVKGPKGRTSSEQEEMAAILVSYPVLYGVARNVEDALRILEVGEFAKGLST